MGAKLLESQQNHVVTYFPLGKIESKDVYAQVQLLNFYITSKLISALLPSGGQKLNFITVLERSCSSKQLSTTCLKPKFLRTAFFPPAAGNTDGYRYSKTSAAYFTYYVDIKNH